MTTTRSGAIRTTPARGAGRDRRAAHSHVRQQEPGCPAGGPPPNRSNPIGSPRPRPDCWTGRSSIHWTWNCPTVTCITRTGRIPIEGRLAPGDVVELQYITPLDLKWHLSRRRVVESRDVSTPWDRADLSDPGAHRRNADVLRCRRGSCLYAAFPQLSEFHRSEQAPADRPGDPGGPQQDAGQRADA